MKRKPNMHERRALMYLRRGNMIGGRTVEALVREAADAIDPEVTHGIRGLGVALPAMASALRLLSEAYAEAASALAVQQERDAARARAKNRSRSER